MDIFCDVTLLHFLSLFMYSIIYAIIHQPNTLLQVLAIEFVPLAIEFVTLAIEFVALAIEFVTLAIEFVALA